jgi:hypothetical protein
MNMVRTKILGWVAGVIAAGAALAGSGSACTLSISEVTSTGWSGADSRGYDVFEQRANYQLVTFRVRSDDDPCPFFVTVAPASGAGDEGQLLGPGQPLPFRVYRDAGGSRPLKPLQLAGPGEVLLGTAPTGPAGTVFEFAYGIPPQRIVAPGDYLGEIEIAAYEGDLQSAVLRDRRRVQVSALVPAESQVWFSERPSFDPTRPNETVRFEQLRGGDERSAAMRVRANAGYEILLQSANGGVLRNSDPSDTSTIPYTLTVDGAPVALPKGGAVLALVGSGATPAIGDLRQLRFTIGNVGLPTAGDYEDTITVTVLSTH